MLRIEVESEDVSARIIKGKRGDFEIKEQDAWAFLHDEHGAEHPYPTRITVRLEQGHSGYSRGTYYLAPQSVYVKDRFGNMAIGRPVLIPADKYHDLFSTRAA